jgi:phospholipid transport system transporter-binding protein
MVADVTALKAGLGRLVRSPHPVALEIAGLERIDTAGLQVIAAFLRDRNERGLRIEWHGTSAPLASAAQLLGLAWLFRLPA